MVFSPISFLHSIFSAEQVRSSMFHFKAFRMTRMGFRALAYRPQSDYLINGKWSEYHSGKEH